MNIRTITAALLCMLGLAACQKPEPYMTLSDKKFVVGEEGTTLTFSIDANTYYRVNNDIDSWARLEMLDQTGNVTNFQLEVSANASPEARKGRVRFIGDGVTPLYVQVEQDGKAPVGVSVNEINVGYTDTKAQFTILGTKAWTASSNNPDFKLNYTSGTGETDITVTFPENEQSSVKTVVITVTIAGESYTVTINQGGAPSKERTDLSAAGTANCYMVNAIGYYKFKATVRGTGIVPESCKSELEASIAPVKAEVLWCTYNTKEAPASKDAIITGVALEDGYVVFNTTNLVELVSGNVIIAVYDASDVILWSWHIWLTETIVPQAIAGKDWLDRHLGATVANLENDGRSFGLFYQWGRKDPLRCAHNFADLEFIGTWPAFTDEMAVVTVDETIGTVMNTIKNPMAFFSTGSGRDWIPDTSHMDRWEDGVKNMFDPCPQGYRVPTEANMEAYAKAAYPDMAGSYKGADYKASYDAVNHVIKNSVWSIPLAGYLYYNSGALTNVGVDGRLMTSTVVATNGNAYYFNGNASASNFANSATRGHAAPIRCVKE